MLPQPPAVAFDSIEYVLFLVAVRPNRHFDKYPGIDRGYLVMAKEVGTCVQSCGLTLTELRLGGCYSGAINSRYAQGLGFDSVLRAGEDPTGAVEEGHHAVWLAHGLVPGDARDVPSLARLATSTATATRT